LVLYAQGAGRAAAVQATGRVKALTDTGHRVLALDLRGLGETAPPRSYDKRQQDFQEAYLALHIGRPLLGQRVLDLLSVLAWTLADPATAPASVAAVGVEAAAPVVLHAAALDPRIAEVTLDRGLVSWSAVARAKLNRDQLANAVPGALRHYDLPDLAASLAPRRLTVEAPVDPMGQPHGG
jgi:pimeloyl-ACP methyl ester carboxylesterase